MDSCEVIEYFLEPIVNRKAIFDVALDRGLGDGMKIEKWILIEMLAQLKKLKEQGVLSKVEGEHKISKIYQYPRKPFKYRAFRLSTNIDKTQKRGKNQKIRVQTFRCVQVCAFLRGVCALFSGYNI